jgi:hypothetical protein
MRLGLAPYLPDERPYRNMSCVEWLAYGLIGHSGRRQSAPGPPELFLAPRLKRSNQPLSSNRICSHSFAISPRDRASFTLNGVPPEIRGRSATPRGEQGMPGADAPAAARGVVVSTRVSHHGHTGITRHSPRNGFNSLFRALPGDRAFLPPSSAKIAFRQLDASVGASGPHDFAVRCQHRPSSALPRPPHPAPTSVTLRNAPLSRAGRRGICR